MLNADTLLPKLTEECKSLLPSGFIFHQDSVPTHMAKLAQDWIAMNCSELFGKDEWLPNSPGVNSLDYHIWTVMLEHYKTIHPQLKNNRLKKVSQLIWDKLPCHRIKAILSFTKRLTACAKTYGGHFEYALRRLFHN